jgi:hypothetical protein
MLIEHEGRSPDVDPGAWVARGTSAAEITRGYAELFGRHRDDQVID